MAELETNGNAVAPGDSGELNPATSGTEERQPAKAPKMVSEEDVRKLQAVKDRETAQERNARIRAEQQAQQAYQQMQRLEQQIHQLQIRDLPQEEQQLAVLQRQLQEERNARLIAEQRERDMAAWQQIREEWNDIHLETGMPMEEIEAMYGDKKTAREIWRTAVNKYAKDGRRNRRKDDDDEEEARSDKAKRNRTDLGEGKAKTPGDERQARINQFHQAKDTKSFLLEYLNRKQQ